MYYFDNNDITEFLSQTPMKLSQLEKEAQIPSGTLSKVKRGERELGPEHASLLGQLMAQYGFKAGRCQVIAITNHKGGVAKTTTAANLANGLADRGQKVLLVDGDAQGNLSQTFSIFVPDHGQLVDALINQIELPIYSISDNLDIVPSDLELNQAESKLNNEVGSHTFLKDALNKVRKQYDFIIIDCPPALNIITYNALVASDQCIIPLQPEPHAVKGLDKILSYVAQVKARVNAQLEVQGILFTKIDKRYSIHKHNMEVVKNELALYDFPVFESMIRTNVAITEAQHERVSIFEYAPTSAGAEDYNQLIEEILN